MIIATFNKILEMSTALRKASILYICQIIFLLFFTPAFAEAPDAESDAFSPPSEHIRIPPPDPDLSAEEVPEWVARWELARVLSYLDRLDESAAQYEKLLDLKPELIEAKVEMLNVLGRQGEQERVIDMLQEVDPDDLEPEARLVLADVYVQSGEYEAAAEIYLSYLEQNPEADRIRLRLAEVLSWAEKYDESIEQYKTLLDARPADKSLRRKYAFVLIWAGHREKGAEELMKTLE